MSSCKPITTPVPIASKPLPSQPSTPTVKLTPTAVNIGCQAAAIVHTPTSQPAAAATPTSIKNYGILVPGNIAASQYSGVLLNATPANVMTTAKSAPVATPTISTGLTVTPVAMTQASSGQPQIAQVLTNLVLKNNGQVQQVQPQVQQQPPPLQAPTVTMATQQVNSSQQMSAAGAISLQQMPTGAPAQLQYILPTVTLQTGPNGKVQNVLQMVLPGAVQPNIQLAIPGQVQPMQMQGQQVQHVQVQQVHQGQHVQHSQQVHMQPSQSNKIHLASTTPSQPAALKITQIAAQSHHHQQQQHHQTASKLVLHPAQSPPQQIPILATGAAAPTIQLINPSSGQTLHKGEVLIFTHNSAELPTSTDLRIVEVQPFKCLILGKLVQTTDFNGF